MQEFFFNGLPKISVWITPIPRKIFPHGGKIPSKVKKILGGPKNKLKKYF